MVGILSTVRDIDRLRQIVGVLVRHGFGEIVQRTGLGRLAKRPSLDTSDLTPSEDESDVGFGERLRLVLQDLGPSFVKLGQIMSTRPDVIPPEIIVELKKLQDDVPTIEFDELRGLVETELGAPINELFTEFDTEPLASASIAQVYRAKLQRGPGEVPADVAVKVQRPNIQATIERDIELLYIVARAIERSIPESRIYAPVGLVQEFDRSMTSELDFTREADNAERFRRAFEDDPAAAFPEVHRDSSSRRVLTLEFITGYKPFDAVDEGYDAEKIAKTGLAVLFKQVFEHGFFHADPHPGNILIHGDPDDPIFGLIDLGLVGRLSPQMRDKTVDLMVAAVRQDSKAVADALYSIGTPTKRIDRAKYDAEVTFLAERYLGKPLKEIEISYLIRDIAGGAMKFGLEIPPEFLMLGRTLMTIEGVGKELHPELDVFSEVRPYFLQLIARRYSPERIGADAMRMIAQIGGTAQSLPSKLDNLLDDLGRGDLVIRVNDPELPRATELLGRRVFSGLTIAAMIGGGSVLIASGNGQIPGYIMLGGAVFWVLGHGSRAFWTNRAMKRRLKS